MRHPRSIRNGPRPAPSPLGSLIGILAYRKSQLVRVQSATMSGETATRSVQQTQPTLVESSVVILANDVNQSIFNPVWLLKNGILLEDEVRLGEAVYVPGLTRVPTESFEFMALPDRLQMKFPPSVDDAGAVLTRVLVGIARTLPHTPFAAVGLNNQYRLTPTDAAGFSEWNRSMFAAPWAASQCKGETRERFGCTFAYDAFGGARMRIRAAVSAQPIDQAIQTDPTPYVVSLHCNLHRDLSPSEVEIAKELPRMLSLWKQVRDESDRIARSLLP